MSLRRPLLGRVAEVYVDRRVRQIVRIHSFFGRLVPQRIGLGLERRLGGISIFGGLDGRHHSTWRIELDHVRHRVRGAVAIALGLYRFVEHTGARDVGDRHTKGAPTPRSMGLKALGLVRGLTAHRHPPWP